MVHPDLIYTVDVGYSAQYPIQPDQHIRRVQVMAPDDAEARLVACQFVGTNHGVCMVTSATIVDCVA